MVISNDFYARLIFLKWVPFCFVNETFKFDEAWILIVLDEYFPWTIENRNQIYQANII